MSSPLSHENLTPTDVSRMNYNELRSVAKKMCIRANQATDKLRQEILKNLEEVQAPPTSARNSSEVVLRTPRPSLTTEAGQIPLPASESSKKKKKSLPKLRFQFGYRAVLETASILIALIGFYVLLSCVRAEPGLMECLACEKQELIEKVQGGYFRVVDAVKRRDTRYEALKELQQALPVTKASNRLAQIFEDIHQSIGDEVNRKGTSIVLYCMHGREVCHEVIDEVLTSIEAQPRFRRCVTSLKAQGYDDEDLAGRTQFQLYSVLRNCSNAVIVFEDLDRMSKGEMVAFLNAMSEGGSLVYDGKSYAANDALYLLTMPGKFENKDLENDSLTFTARQEFYSRVVGDNLQNENFASIATAFRRRIDFAVPVIRTQFKA